MQFPVEWRVSVLGGCSGMALDNVSCLLCPHQLTLRHAHTPHLLPRAAKTAQPSGRPEASTARRLNPFLSTSVSPPSSSPPGSPPSPQHASGGASGLIPATASATSSNGGVDPFSWDLLAIAIDQAASTRPPQQQQQEHEEEHDAVSTAQLEGRSVPMYSRGGTDFLMNFASRDDLFNFITLFESLRTQRVRQLMETAENSTAARIANLSNKLRGLFSRSAPALAPPPACCIAAQLPDNSPLTPDTFERLMWAFCNEHCYLTGRQVALSISKAVTNQPLTIQRSGFYATDAELVLLTGAKATDWPLSGKGETGAMPILAADYTKLIHSNAVPSWPSGWNARLLSINWSEFTERIWNDIRYYFPSIRLDNSHPDIASAPPTPFDFEWRGLDRSLPPRLSNKVVFKARPIDFSFSAGCWAMSVGSMTSGTCFRSAGDSLPEHNAWRSNAISNVYHVQMHCPQLPNSSSPRVTAAVTDLRSSSSSTTSSASSTSSSSSSSSTASSSSATPRAMFNLYRHGIVGYAASDAACVRQAQLLLQDAVRRQRILGLPARIVTHNLATQFKIAGEQKMVERQQSAFFTAAMDTEMSRMSGAFELASFYLPTNSDKSIMMISDTDAELNRDGAIMYTNWVILDCTRALDNVFLTQQQYLDRYAFCSDSSRWTSEVLADCPFSHRLRQQFAELDTRQICGRMMAQYPEDHDQWELLFGHCSDGVCWSVPDILRNMLARTAELRTVAPTASIQATTRCILLALSALLRFVCLSLYDATAGGAGGVDLRASGDGSVDPPIVPAAVLAQLERSRISINLLRALLHAECYYQSDRIDLSMHLENESTSSAKAIRTFTRTSALYIASLLDYTLGVATFVNCKSGIDRTGIFTAIYQSLAACWELYPQHRWALHMVACNYNILRRRSKEHHLQPGKVPLHPILSNTSSHMPIPPSERACAEWHLRTSYHTHQEFAMQLAAESMLRMDSPLDDLVGTMKPPPYPVQMANSWAMIDQSPGMPKVESLEFLLNLDVTTATDIAVTNECAADSTRQYNQEPDPTWVKRLFSAFPGQFMIDGSKLGALYRLIPLFCVLRNFAFAYLVEVNASIAFVSTGVRGMKYIKHPLVGGILPRTVMDVNDKLYQLTDSHTRVVYSFQILTEIGQSLLVDLATRRKS